MEEKIYQEFIGKQVRVITTGRLTNKNYYNMGNSLQLEGLLDKETETQIFLKNMGTSQIDNQQLTIKSEYGAISKSQIISLYLDMVPIAPLNKDE